MPFADSLKKLSWQSVRSIALAHRVVPDVPGVYAFSETTELHGLVVTLDWVYVGQAASLPARLAHHRARTEANRRLRDWLHRPGDRMLWYAPVDSTLLNQVERDLIASLHPRFNRTLYAQHLPTV